MTSITSNKFEASSVTSYNEFITIFTTVSSSHSHVVSINSNATITRNANEPTHIAIQTIANNENASSNSVIGLGIGLPVGLFGLCIIIFLCYFHFRKNYINNVTHYLSPSTSTMSSQSNWFYRKLYGNKKLWTTDDIINEKSLPFHENMFSKVQYNISNPIHKHVMTPKKSVNPLLSNIKYDQSVENLEVEKYLYTKPPNIHQIASVMPLVNNLDGYTKVNDSVRGTVNPPVTAWKYESPLSRWFLRSSIYLSDHGISVGKLNKTPTIQLKQLNILSRIHRGDANTSNLVNEKSPILVNIADETQGSSPRSTYIIDEIVPNRPASAIYGTIQTQTIEYGDKDDTDVKIMKLKSVPKRKKINPELTKSRRKKLRRHLDQLAKMKPLPLTPKSKYRIGGIHQVIENYDSRLVDEVTLRVGEYARILAAHTDGWCLIEKCTEDGTTKSLLKNKNIDIADMLYLNDDRGIVPGKCLG